MSTHKHIDLLGFTAIVLCLLLTVAFLNGEALGIRAADRTMGYETRLFDTSAVHTVDIVMEDWEEFLETCENEEYAACSVVIDGEAYKNVGLRAKGNTSLSSVSSMGSDRYSFKIEFDHYDSTKSYYGLDKLSLNNLIQDNTYMKDYLTYQLMGSFGVDSPLCSYVYITVNGEDWGLYLAVEGVEDAFLQRNYGTGYGELYKPDSMSFGGGRGNGRGFDMDGLLNSPGEEDGGNPEKSASPQAPEGGMPENFDPAAFFKDGQIPEGLELPGGQQMPGRMGKEISEGTVGFGGGMGSSDVKLQYIDDDPDSYANIFDNAKTALTDADKERLIASLKSLNEGENIESVVNVEEVLRYFVVHNFVVNGDSYTGSMIHNYYLYEKDGQLSMIPWDYNLAFGTFQGGDTVSAVNDPIDDVLEDRPMQAWIFSSEEYTELYHQYFADFLKSTDFAGIIEKTTALIAPYVEKDPTKFCTYEEFEIGVSTLQAFCQLRAESVAGQLDRTIPSTSEGQSSNRSALVDASEITLSDMGSMGGIGGGFGGRGGQISESPDGEMKALASAGIPSFENGAFASGIQPGAEEKNSGASQPEMPQRPDGTSGMDAEMSAPEMPQKPDGTNGEFPGDADSGNNRFSPGGDFQMPGGSEMASASAGSTLILLGVSVLVLAGGLILAFRFRR